MPAHNNTPSPQPRQHSLLPQPACFKNSSLHLCAYSVSLSHSCASWQTVSQTHGVYFRNYANTPCQTLLKLHVRLSIPRTHRHPSISRIDGMKKIGTDMWQSNLCSSTMTHSTPTGKDWRHSTYAHLEIQTSRAILITGFTERSLYDDL